MEKLSSAGAIGANARVNVVAARADLSNGFITDLAGYPGSIGLWTKNYTNWFHEDFFSYPSMPTKMGKPSSEGGDVTWQI
jgi:hypothetical protein